MAKYIYDCKNYRCRVSYDSDMKDFELQLQKRSFLFIWVNIYDPVICSEEDGYIFGNNDRMIIDDDFEVYRSGALDLKKRAQELFKSYYESCRLDTYNRAKIDVL